MPHSCDPVIFLLRRVWSPVLLRIHDHGTELKNHKVSSAKRHSLLPVKYRTMILRLNRNGCDKKDRTQYPKRQRTEYHIAKPLHSALNQTKPIVPVHKQRRIEQIQLL